MTMATKNAIFSRYLTEYISASRLRKEEILDSVCDVLTIHRKSAIRRFRTLQLQDGEPKHRGRNPLYNEEVISALETVWGVLGELCGELVHPMISEMIMSLQKKGEWWHNDEATGKLLRMSLSTVKRAVGKFMKVRKRRRGMSATSPSHIKHIIPIFSGPWEGKPPGYGQIDTVVHCGNTLSGDVVYSVNNTDVATSWVVLAAQWNKSQEATTSSLKRMKDKLPFPLLGLHPDTGSEFVNYHLKQWCDEDHIELTRSRPNHKNDNAYVEQKNGHVIRRFLGYERFDCMDTVPVINKLYDVLELHLNHFVPTRKCVSKVRVGARYQRKYDVAATPYQRVMKSHELDDRVKEKLKAVHEKLNPLQLHDLIDKLIRKTMRIQSFSNRKFVGYSVAKSR
jgi:hypothetical protein